MQIRDRIRELRRVRASELRPNPKNWRTHSQSQQDALRGVLAEVGYADALLAREMEDGSLMLVDGHLRAETTPEQDVPVLVLDVTESEADKILATLDPLAGMAERDDEKLRALMASVAINNEIINALANANDGEVAMLRPVTVKPPPRMSWVLLGIPTIRFGDISEDIERLSKVVQVCETTVNDDDENGQQQSCS